MGVLLKEALRSCGEEASQERSQMQAQITALQEVKQLLLLRPHCHLHKDAHMKLFWRSPLRMSGSCHLWCRCVLNHARMRFTARLFESPGLSRM